MLHRLGTRAVPRKPQALGAFAHHSLRRKTGACLRRRRRVGTTKLCFDACTMAQEHWQVQLKGWYGGAETVVLKGHRGLGAPAPTENYTTS